MNKKFQLLCPQKHSPSFSAIYFLKKCSVGHSSAAHLIRSVRRCFCCFCFCCCFSAAVPFPFPSPLFLSLLAYYPIVFSPSETQIPRWPRILSPLPLKTKQQIDSTAQIGGGEGGKKLNFVFSHLFSTTNFRLANCTSKQIPRRGSRQGKVPMPMPYVVCVPPSSHPLLGRERESWHWHFGANGRQRPNHWPSTEELGLLYPMFT